MREEEKRRGRETACWWPTFHRNASFVESHGGVACLHLNNATEPSSCAQLSAGKVCEATFHGRRFNEATPLLFGSGLFIRGKCLCWRALSVQPTTEAAAQTLLSPPPPSALPPLHPDNDGEAASEATLHLPLHLAALSSCALLRLFSTFNSLLLVFPWPSKWNFFRVRSLLSCSAALSVTRPLCTTKKPNGNVRC